MFTSFGLFLHFVHFDTQSNIKPKSAFILKAFFLRISNCNLVSKYLHFTLNKCLLLLWQLHIEGSSIGIWKCIFIKEQKKNEKQAETIVTLVEELLNFFFHFSRFSTAEMWPSPFFTSTRDQQTMERPWHVERKIPNCLMQLSRTTGNSSFIVSFEAQKFLCNTLKCNNCFVFWKTIWGVKICTQIAQFWR